MFTAEQIIAVFSTLRTGADFPRVAGQLKHLGIIRYETRMEDGQSVFYGAGNYQVHAGAVYDPICVADKVNIRQLESAIRDHQQGKSGYIRISRQSAGNGVAKWAVDLVQMTCSYIDKVGNQVWVEQIPTIGQNPFTAEEVSAAHRKVRSGADFPVYIREIKALGVTHYECYVSDGHTDYHGADNYTAKVPAKYPGLSIADIPDTEQFRKELKVHQQGGSDFLTFIKLCAVSGIDKWVIRMEQMTCTYYDKAGNILLVEQIPS